MRMRIGRANYGPRSYSFLGSVSKHGPRERMMDPLGPLEYKSGIQEIS